MSTLTPALVLEVTLALTALAAFLEAASRRRRKRALRRLARQWHMTFSARDLLRLTPKVAAGLPVPGAADVYVKDVIYSSDADSYRYIFTAEYTTGVVQGKRRRARVASFLEPRERQADARETDVLLAPEDVPIIEQYRRLASAFQVAQTAPVHS